MLNMNNVEQQINTLKGLVEYVLENNPETRDNDAKLYVKVCRELNLNTLEDIYEYGISPMSVTRVRQQIQNEEKKFQPSESIAETRKNRNIEFKKLFKKLKEAN